MEEIIALAKRRSFFYPSSMIYGGLANTWDFGHYGTLLKNNIRDLWIKRFVTGRSDMVMVDSSIILNPKVWEASGHVAGFADALVDCKNCKTRTRADHLIEDKLKDTKVEGLPVEKLTEIIKTNKLKCPKCGSTDLTDVRKFNLLFETKIGMVEEAKSKAYLRGELAQGIFMNFKQTVDTMRVRMPFGIASVGVCFRNEITLGQGVFRTLQFDLMEFEYFIKDGDWKKIFEYWQKEMHDFAVYLGLNPDKIRFREHEDFERSFYSKRTVDLEYQFPTGWKEMWGLAYRTDYDLSNHIKHSGVDLKYRDPKTNEEFVPHVIEPTFGLSRLLITILTDSYREEEVNGKKRVVLKLNPLLSPVKAAIFPLQKDEKLAALAKEIYLNLKKSFYVEYDDAGNIGKMYRRQDEIGTPYCITVDYQTQEDQAVTVRDRDTMGQERIPILKLREYIEKKLT
jgi:glycyl-tRNA synthetase